MPTQKAVWLIEGSVPALSHSTEGALTMADWIKPFKADKREIFRAAAVARKIADMHSFSSIPNSPSPTSN
jgi:antirestriction protein ArdC